MSARAVVGGVYRWLTERAEHYFLLIDDGTSLRLPMMPAAALITLSSDTYREGEIVYVTVVGWTIQQDFERIV